MDDVEDDGNGQHGARDPMIGYPGKLDAHLRQESGKQQREHGRCHDPVKQPRRQRVPRDAFGQLRRDLGRRVVRKLLGLGEIPQPSGVNDQEEQPRDHRNPDQEPGDMNRDTLPPRTRGPLYDAHVASSTPPMARFTRFLISGIL